VGFYHFFSYDSAGTSQAENFIRNVSPFVGMLPPVVDVEFYGNYGKSPKPREDVTPQLTAMLTALEAHYGLKPILYATEASYEWYLEGDFAEYDIWIRNVLTKPSLSDGRSWTFWQYTNREKLNGYHGKETYIDMNVFQGDREAFLRYPRYTET
jgi:lysozyme